MKRNIKYFVIAVLTGMTLASCNWFDVETRNILTEEQTYSSKDGVLSVLANIYGRLPDGQAFNTDVMNDWDEATTDAHNKGDGFESSYRRYWDYDLIREINLFIENVTKYGTALNPKDQTFFIAEGRFLRAYTYFHLVKHMGGVPLILRSFTLEEGNGDANYWKFPRDTEEDVYRFICTEMEAIKDDLDARVNNTAVKNRASKGAALALESRAALYAASIARYTPTRTDLNLQTPGWEAGIPADKAEEFYQISLKASREIINDMKDLYDLYDVNPDKATNFYEALTKKNGNNPEVIFVKDYDGDNVLNYYTESVIPRSMRVGGGSHVNPTLNMVEQFETIDGETKIFKTNKNEEVVEEPSVTTSDEDYIIYDEAADMFAGRDPRLEGSILTPGSSFRNQELQLWAGLAVKTGKHHWEFKSVAEMEDLSSANEEVKMYGGRIMTGADGPHASIRSTNPEQVTGTGFLIRKYVDSKPGSEQLGQSDLAFIRFRFGEVLLNAAEAAWELNDPTAIEYLNRVRRRAGVEELPAIKGIETFVHERAVELAFEDHRFYDLKRWRMSDKLFDGNRNTPTALLTGLWPYKIYAPGDPDDEKWIFRRVRAIKRDLPLRFRNYNYYSSIDQAVLNDNSLLVKNPYQE